MELMPYISLEITLAYLIGSIPSSVVIGKTFYDTDVRQHGSGNPGATNTFRVLGKKAGIIVLLIDVLKGYLATSLITFIPLPVDIPINYQVALGIAAILGHIFPIWLKFKGGKGIATTLGMLIAIAPVAALVCTIIFTVMLLITRYVSLSSIITSIVFPILVVFVFKVDIIAFKVFAFALTLLILYTHSDNIRRLLKGEENKANLFKKKNESTD